jgi:limonene-1,2-epoxide hydrolase
MESPIEVVRRFCAAWSDNMGAAELSAFFTEDAVYHNIPLEPITGRENIASAIASFLRPGPPGIESIDFRLINIAANGPVVMTERVDVFTLPSKSFELPVMGTFEVSDGKIIAWRDYFDMNQFMSRMG